MVDSKLTVEALKEALVQKLDLIISCLPGPSTGRSQCKRPIKKKQPSDFVLSASETTGENMCKRTCKFPIMVNHDESPCTSSCNQLISSQPPQISAKAKYFCPNCPKSFCRSDNRKRHIKIVHDRTPAGSYFLVACFPFLLQLQYDNQNVYLHT